MKLRKYLSLSLKNQLESCCASKNVTINKIIIKTMKTTPFLHFNNFYYSLISSLVSLASFSSSG